MSRKYFLILNPTAQSGKGKNKWTTIFETMKTEGLTFEHKESSYSGHAIELATQAALSGKYSCIVAVGGDGTISEVLNGLHQASLKIGSQIPALGILYTGTSPDICKFHKIPLDMQKAVMLLKYGQEELVDVGRVEYLRQGDNYSTWFLCSVNLGIGAAVAEGSNSGLRKYLGDFLGTLLSLFLATARYRLSNFTVTIDGKEQILDSVLNLTIGKNPHIASGIKVDLPLEPSDGKMYLFTIQNKGLFSLLWNIKKVYDGSFIHHPDNRLIYLEEFECQNNEFAPQVEFDGDPQGELPCKIRLDKKGLRLIR